jgi:hypothetical protein
MAGIEYGSKGNHRTSHIIHADPEAITPVAATEDASAAADASFNSSSKTLINKHLQLLLQSNVLYLTCAQ